ncbi:hemolysin D [Pedobacter quisquiliarum]|uniref:Hemolysin D n=1 Tax=Pedobacter quisquiliarum TaxID=1834438 RepID=A0A916TZB5_9SPHI|nr:HlyD family secretion protein [Pedobacter quisquiliarum]GGC53240.1 hemolysin D [Pedobacter quisquiliarum]
MTTNTDHSRTDKLITQITACIAGAILLVLVIWGCFTLWDLYRYEETNDAQVQEYINPVTSRVGGFIKEIRFEENQEIKKGDTLIMIDNREYELQEQQAQAELANAKAQLAVLKSHIGSGTASAQINESQIIAAKARLHHEEQEFARYKKLYDVESATRQQLENVQTALEVARANYESALKNYEADKSKVQDTRVQTDVAEAEIKRREAMLNRNKLDVGYTVVVAPYDCKMGRRTIQPGQMVQAGQTLAYIVDQEAGKWVVANFKETQLRHMHVGEMAEITTDAYPGRTFMGKIESLSPATGSSFSLLPPDNSTGNFVKIVQRVPVRIRLVDKPEEIATLRAGMNAEVLIRKVN